MNWTDFNWKVQFQKKGGKAKFIAANCSWLRSTLVSLQGRNCNQLIKRSKVSFLTVALATMNPIISMYTANNKKNNNRELLLKLHLKGRKCSAELVTRFFSCFVYSISLHCSTALMSNSSELFESNAATLTLVGCIDLLTYNCLVFPVAYLITLEYEDTWQQDCNTCRLHRLYGSGIIYRNQVSLFSQIT